MKRAMTLSAALGTLALAAFSWSAVAQTGSPNAGGSREINQNQQPKGNIGTSSTAPDSPSRGSMSGTTSGSGMGGTGSSNPPPNAEINQNMPPKGNAAGSSAPRPEGPTR